MLGGKKGKGKDILLAQKIFCIYFMYGENKFIFGVRQKLKAKCFNTAMHQKYLCETLSRLSGNYQKVVLSHRHGFPSCGSLLKLFLSTFLNTS